MAAQSKAEHHRKARHQSAPMLAVGRDKGDQSTGRCILTRRGDRIDRIDYNYTSDAVDSLCGCGCELGVISRTPDDSIEERTENEIVNTSTHQQQPRLYHRKGRDRAHGVAKT